MKKKKTKKNPHAVALGRKGAQATNKKLSKQEMKEKMSKASRTRWDKIKMEEKVIHSDELT